MKSEISDWIREAERKQQILNLLLMALRKTEDLCGLRALEYVPGQETVTAAFASGHKKVINISGDSDLVMIYDVVVNLWGEGY